MNYCNRTEDSGECISAGHHGNLSKYFLKSGIFADDITKYKIFFHLLVQVGILELQRVSAITQLYLRKKHNNRHLVKESQMTLKSELRAEWQIGRASLRRKRLRVCAIGCDPFGGFTGQ
jgi:hypothetical protein